MKHSLLICIIATILGAISGYFVPLTIPAIYTKLFSVAILAGIESVSTALRFYAKKEFQAGTFIVNFCTNIIIVVAFVYFGGKLGLDLYYVAILALGIRLLMNLDKLKAYLFTK